jgi:gamma-glutamylcyclotransferase (GGCT)/AIG2-like uncharacterized protein YtfP
LEQLEETGGLDQPPVFVYGSLRHGLENYGLLRGKTLAEIPALLRGVRMFSLGWYPIIVNAPEDQQQVIHGELMIIHPQRYSETLAALDVLEGYVKDREAQCLYRRELRCVTARSGRELEAWVYVGSDDLISELEHELLPTGDWVQWRADRLLGLRG